MPTLSYIRLGAPVIPGDLPAAITGAWASAEAPDYAAMAGMVITAGVWSSTEAPDTAGIAGNLTTWGTLAVTEGADVAEMSGGEPLPANSVAPSISGTATVGETLTASPGTWSGSPTYAYQWRRDGVDISGATAATYELVPEDEDADISVAVTGSNAAGSAVAYSEAVGPVTDPAPPVPLETQLATLLSPGATRLEILWPSPEYWYQDVAGTVPVTIEGQSVRCWRSLAGTSYTQPTNADYAPLASKLPNGAWALSFDGVDDGLRSADPLDMTASDKMAVIVGFRMPAAAPANGMLIETSPSVDTDGGTIFLIRRSGGQHEWRSRGSGTSRAVLTSNMSQPNTLVMTGIGDIAAPLSRLRVNGAGLTDVTLSQGLGPFGSHVLYVGRRGGTTLPWKGLLGPLVLRGGPLPDLATVEAAEAIINQHMGAY